MLFTISSFFTHKAYPKALKALFIAKLLRDYGFTVGTFFFPLFLFQMGPLLPLPSLSAFQRGMIAVGLYFLIQRSGVGLFAVFGPRFIRKIGVKNGMIIGILLHACAFGLLTIAQRYPILMIAVLLIEMIRMPLYWVSYYTLFSEFALYKNMGESVGTSEFMTKMVQASAPAIAGLLIVGFGHSYVFLTALAFQIFSVCALLFIDTQVKLSEPSVLQFRTWIQQKENRQLSVSAVGKYVTEALYLLWPFFVYFLIGSVDRVGFLYSIVYFISLLVIYFTGWYIDHSKNRIPFSLSGSLMGGLWIVRSVVSSPWLIIVTDSVDKILGSIFLPFYESLLLRRAKKTQDVFSTFVYREIVVCVGAMTFWICFIVYFLLFDNWRSVVVLGFISMLGSLQLNKTKSQ